MRTPMKIEWFPGHMNKASRQIAETIQGFDVIIEVLDARLPVSSANPLLEELRRGKPCIKVLNKNDLADVVTKAWVRHFAAGRVRALPLEARKRLGWASLTLPSPGAPPRAAGQAAARQGHRHPQRRQVDPDQHPGGQGHGPGRRSPRHHHLPAADRPA
jgi:hypothetical protein